MESKAMYKRVFLNNKKGLAAMSVGITKESERHDYIEFSAGIELTDCNRMVRIDLDFWTPQMKRERMKKVDTMIKLLADLYDKMESAEVKKY